MRQIVAWTILLVAGAVFVTAPLWLWWVSGDIESFYGAGVVCWGVAPAGILIAWALAELV